MGLRDTLRPCYRIARRGLRCIENCVDAPIVTLLYHRVTSLDADPHQLAVTPDNFRVQLAQLKRNYPILRFDSDWSHVKKASIAITFDDGYADNYQEALPILEELQIPATFFVTTGFIGGEREFWWDELERIIFDSRQTGSRFSVGRDAVEQVWPTESAREKTQFFWSMHDLLNQRMPTDREKLLARLRDWANDPGEARTSHRVMSIDELRALSDSSVSTVGAHCESHTRLSLMDTEAQRREIAESKSKLERWTGRQVPCFSYPFGGKDDFNDVSINLCREVGFTKAAANYSGQAHSWTNKLCIPRALVRNWSRNEFEQALRSFWT